MYSNADSLLNKKHELELLVNNLTTKLVTGVNYKNMDFKYEMQELHMLK